MISFCLYIIIKLSQLMPNQNLSLTHVIFFLLFSLSCLAYKEFALSRSALTQTKSNCSQFEYESARTYSQLCYLKDVNYHMQLFIDGLVYYVAVDLTTPLSWLKSPNCKNGLKGCSIIKDQQKSQTEQDFKHVLVKFRLFGRGKDKDNKDVVLVGSSDFVAGELQNIQFGQLYAKDSKSAREFTRLLGLSLFLTPEKDLISINNASILKAEKLSQGVNEMTDGAISFRSNNESQNLISQLFANSQSSQKVVTIFLHPSSKQGTLSVGDISLKNTRSKTSDIVWVSMKQNNHDSIQCLSTGMAIQLNHARSSTHQISIHSANDIVFTTSSSFIFLTSDLLEWLAQTLEQKTKASCQISKDSDVFRCEWKELQGKKQAILLTLQLKLMQKASIVIPFTTLILISEQLFIQFTIKSAPSGKIIMGEPFFQQYVTFIDYSTNKIGFAPALFHNSDKFTKILVYFLRFLLFGSISLFCLYFCFKPLTKLKSFLAAIGMRIRLFLQNKTYEMETYSIDRFLPQFPDLIILYQGLNHAVCCKNIQHLKSHSLLTAEISQSGNLKAVDASE